MWQYWFLRCILFGLTMLWSWLDEININCNCLKLTFLEYIVRVMKITINGAPITEARVTLQQIDIYILHHFGLYSCQFLVYFHELYHVFLIKVECGKCFCTFSFRLYKSPHIWPWTYLSLASPMLYSGIPTIRSTNSTSAKYHFNNVSFLTYYSMEM